MDLSSGALLASLIVSTAGFGLFSYGKKQSRMPQLGAGVALMIFPYFVTGAAAIWGIAAGVSAVLILAVRSGV